MLHTHPTTAALMATSGAMGEPTKATGRMMLIAALFLLSPSLAQAATMKCRGFSFFYAEFNCDIPLPPATAGATFCQVAKPITWSGNDTRATKEQVDAHNRVGKSLCGWGHKVTTRPK